MRKLSKILVLVLVLTMMFAMSSMFTTSAASQPEYLYLTPNANWKQSNARFAAYFFGNGETWVSMTDSNGDGVYEVKVPTAKTYPNVIFCRMNPGASANNWNNKWNQTADLTIPTSGANHFTVKEGTWDSGGGTWSTYGSTCKHTNVGPAATCTTAQECLDCGDPVVSALGHTFNSSHLCTRCNEQASFTVAGSGAHLGTEWDTGNTANDMTYADGVYTKVYENVAAGSYALKVVRDHAWGTAYPSADKAYTVAKSGSIVTVTLKGTVVTVDVHAHEYEAAVTTAPTYTTEGLITYTCSCGDSYTEVMPVVVPEFPGAVVTPIENPELTFALNFGIADIESIEQDQELLDALFATYGDMYVDYRLTIEGLNADSVVFNSDGTQNGYLGGQYDAWSTAWVYVPFGDSVTVSDGESIYIMQLAAEMMGEPGLRYTLAEIIAIVVDFDCGVYFTPEFLAANPDMKVTLELIVFEEDEDGNKILLNGAPIAKNEFFAHQHVWSDATCTEPSKCECGETQGEALGHTWVDATCTAPKTCSVCNATEGEALGHNFFAGSCKVCQAIDPDYNAYILNFSKWPEFAKETYADGDVLNYNDIFTFIMSKNSRVDTSSKTWDDFTGTLRFSFGGKTPTGSVPSKNALKITADGAYIVKIWYVAGGDGRYFALLDENGTVMAETTKDTIKNSQYYAELVIPAAGTYYFGVPGDNNYIFQIELVKHTHVYTDVVTAPTCTEAGYTTHTCTCGYSFNDTEVAALGHDMLLDAAVDATCTSTGLTEGSHCSRCDHKVAQEEVPALGHTEVVDAAVDATCTETGLTEGKHCSVCNEVLVAQETTDALGHDMVVDAAVAPGCETTGLTEGSHCSRCDHKVAQEEIPATGHSFADGKCETCGAADPDHVPEEPQEDPSTWESIWAIILKILNAIIAFFKGLFA